MDDAPLDAPAFAARALSKNFGATKVLQNIDLSILKGQTIALLGRSGSGKSTLLKCLNLLEPPDTGELELRGQLYFMDGTVLYEPWEVRREVALVMQDYMLFPNMTVRENLTFPLQQVKGITRRAAEAQNEELIHALEITSLLDRYPDSLSGGQTQRCALARALALEPKVLLLDEITSALDPETIRSVVGAIRRIREFAGTKDMAIVLVTHLLSFATQFADEILYLYGGQIVERHRGVDFVREVKNKEACRFVEAHVDFLV